jgi:hypothetical protein
MGAVRGVFINICVNNTYLTQSVSDSYKILNSTIALPLWFTGISYFIESRRVFEGEFRNLFAKAIIKEQETHERANLLSNRSLQIDEHIARLQYFASSLGQEFQKLQTRSKKLTDYSKQAQEIDYLLSEKIRPANKEIYLTSLVQIPKISLWSLIKIALLDTHSKMLWVVLLSTPYLFMGINGAKGARIAIGQTLILSLTTLIYFFLSKILIRFGILTFRQSNYLFFGACLFVTLIIQLVLIPDHLRFSSDFFTVIIYQLFLTLSFIMSLIIVNATSILGSYRETVIADLLNIIDGPLMNEAILQSADSQRGQLISNFIHGEVQSGLIASSLLLKQAAITGDSDLADEALSRAVGLLNQDLTNISMTRMATPLVRLNKIVDGWKGIADISVLLPSFDLLDELLQRKCVQLIEEGVSNAIRHAHSTNLKISGVIKGDLLTISIRSNGDPVIKSKSGLGTALFNELTEEWSQTKESGNNLLTFTLKKL